MSVEIVSDVDETNRDTKWKAREVAVVVRGVRGTDVQPKEATFHVVKGDSADKVGETIANILANNYPFFD